MDDNATRKRPSALLLLGPTGAGKTPLGQMLEDRGFLGRSCVHFDFGENLRGVVARNQPDDLISQPEIDFLRSVLETGVLLEDKHFYLAERILRAFLRQRSIDADGWIILNGLPRHVGQAEAVEAVVAVRAVVCLVCSDETVYRRIQTNAGGDREGRLDDDFQAVCHKLETYRRRTAPLLNYYRHSAANVYSIDVMPETSVEEIWQRFAFFRDDC